MNGSKPIIDTTKVKFKQIKLNDIKITSRLRSLNQDFVVELAKSIKATGLINPISVSNGILVTGLHRLEAFRLLGYEQITCKILDFISDPDLLKRIEIEDNLLGGDMNPKLKNKLQALSLINK